MPRSTDVELAESLANPDVELLRTQAKKLRWVFHQIELVLLDDPAHDPWDLRKPKKGRRMTPDVKANIAAMIATNELISWFARREGGFVGLWRGPQHHPLAEAPIVTLDSEGQYSIGAITVGDYLARSAPDGVFAEVRREVVAAGFKVARSRDAIYRSIDAYDKSDDPNEYRNKLYNANRRTKKPAKKR